jgi:hypothetical protein
MSDLGLFSPIDDRPAVAWENLEMEAESELAAPAIFGNGGKAER